MTTMRFLSFLQAYLLSNDSIYTVRRYKYNPSQEAIFVPGIGGCHRELVREDVTKEDLIQYSGSSGFTTVDGWWDMIVKINPQLPKLYLYYVCVVRRLK